MEIRFATKEMIPQIKEIWHRCFGDEEDYMEFYFTHRFTEENMLVCMEDKKPVAMTTFLKAYLVTGEGEIPVHYAYASSPLSSAIRVEIQVIRDKITQSVTN